MQLHGLHHVTAITARASENHRFYTDVLGLRLVKKTVNQDDVSAYHLFYADGLARPGTDLTFFDFPTLPERRGSHSIARTGLRVADTAALDYFRARLADHGVSTAGIAEVDGRAELAFEDPEGQRLALVVDGGQGDAAPWARSPVPEPHQIRGLGPVTISLRQLAPSEKFLTDILGMRKARSYDTVDAPVHVFEMGEGGPAAELHLRIDAGLPPAQQGAGAVHHVAFRVRDDEYAGWIERYQQLGVRSSGPVDRFYFRSLYAREPGGILYEIATDGPGFATDESVETMGESLSLPPFLEQRRAEIERGLKAL